MKKVLAIFLAAVMVLSLSVPAFAEVKVNESTIESPAVVEGNAQYVSANASGDQLTVNGDVIGASSADSVYAADSAKITVSGSVTEEGANYAVRANSGSNVTVEINITELGAEDAIYTSNNGKVFVGGNISESDAGDAVDAIFGSSVEVTGNVTESGAGNAIQANGASTQTGAAATVTVKGNVTEEGDGNAIYAQNGATVIVYCNVYEKDGGSAINATKGSKVIVGGNVTEKGDGKNNAVSVSGENTTVIIEGTVDVDGNVGATGTGAALYLGELKKANQIIGTDNIHYLIGTKQDGNFIQLGELTFSGNVGDATVDGINKSYQYTNKADTSEGLKVNIKSATNKKLKVDSSYSLPTGLKINTKDDGSLELVMDSTFVGGLQELMIVAADIVTRSGGGGSSKPIFTGRKGNPVTNGKWTQNADGTWSYGTSYKFTNDWAYIAKPGEEGSAAWYRFDRNGNMLTGWQLLTWNGVKKWFYFIEAKGADEGKCQLGGVTPDGYALNPDGSWKEN